MDDERIQRFINVLNFQSLTLPFVYLGIPIGANPRREETWIPIMNNISKRLTLWKCHKLSMTGRVCLINFVLYSLPIFLLPFLEFQKWLQRKFKVYKLDFYGKEKMMIRKALG